MRQLYPRSWICLNLSQKDSSGNAKGFALSFPKAE
jgi:hypothetical protein